MNTNKNNILLAEFMGIDQVDIDTYQETNCNLKYHISWAWLMPVVMKISRKIDKPLDEVISLLTEVGSDNIWDIKSFYNAIVEFIKEYNKNK